jgi:hypothetical protein
LEGLEPIEVAELRRRASAIAAEVSKLSADLGAAAGALRIQLVEVHNAYFMPDFAGQTADELVKAQSRLAQIAASLGAVAVGDNNDFGWRRI